MKKLFKPVRLLAAGFLTISAVQSANGQCGFFSGYGCPGTNYNNYGVGASGAATLEYDNMVSTFHSTLARDYTGAYRIWGENVGADGVADLLSPVEINSINFPGLTGHVLKATMGSFNSAFGGGAQVQTIVLTTDGLFVWGTQGMVLNTAIKTGTALEKITVGGVATGLPAGVAPTQVKMIFAAQSTLAITTCDGHAYVLSDNAASRAAAGDGGASGRTTWAHVQEATAGNPFLTGVVAVRGVANRLMALKNDGTVWTWGSGVYLGNGTANNASFSRATQMTLPPGEPGAIKMIGMTSAASHYVLYENGHLYSLGANTARTLGDFTTIAQLSWVQPLYAAGGAPMNDILWISPNEHDPLYAAINVINSAYQVYNWGTNNNGSIGRGSNITNVDPGIPEGLTIADKVLMVETGGHTSMLAKTCTQNFGYVGHRVGGSMGNGSATSVIEGVYTYATADVQICGATTVPQIFTGGAGTTGATGKYCNSSSLTLSGLPSDGTFAVVSGPGTLAGNRLSFTGTGTVTISYTANTADCAGSVATKTFEVEDCSLYSISGTLFNDANGNASQEALESGIDNGLWVNLVAPDGTVAGSAKIASDGTYTLAIRTETVTTGNYSIILTNGEKQAGSALASADAPNADFGYTGTSVNGVANTGNRTGIISIGSLTGNLAAADFGISNDPAVLPVKFGFVAAEILNNQLLVKWNTLNETNNSHFEIELSNDGTNFLNVGKVDSKAPGGASTGVIEYEFSKEAAGAVVAAGIALLLICTGLFKTRSARLAIWIAIGGMTALVASCNKSKRDVLPEGKLYVRIAQVDKDGIKSYSKVVAVVRR
jgi:alpha-tubulin suppressor-like RCC1 family protein